jgi:cell division protein FtsQ
MKTNLSFIKIAKMLSWIAVASLFVFLCVAAFHRVDSLRTNQVQVIIDNENNNFFLTDDEVRKEIVMANPEWTGKRIKDIHIDRIEKSLKNNEYIEDAEIYMSPNAIMKVKIKQKNPLVRVNDLGESYYISDQWKKIPLDLNFTKRVIQVGGINPWFFVPKTARDSFYQKRYIRFLDYVCSDPFWNRAIDQIYFDQNGKVSLYLVFSDLLIKFGSIDESMEKRFNKIVNFFKIVPMTKDLTRYSSLDFEYNMQVVAKLKTN